MTHPLLLEGRKAAGLIASDSYAAIRQLEGVVGQLTADNDDIAPELHELLGQAWFSERYFDHAVAAFMRAIDREGSTALPSDTREVSARNVVLCLLGTHRFNEALRNLHIYEQAFGPHPDGWTTEQLVQHREQRRQQLSKVVPC